MAGRLNERESQLQAHREHNLQNEKMLAIATQAAGTAHELGTPLGTIAVTLDNIASNPDDKLGEQLEVAQQQVAICRNSLQRLVATASERAQHSSYIAAAEDYLEDLLDLWLLIRPDADLNVEWADEGTRNCLLETTPALDQAILNLLNNAADACPDNLQMALSFDGKSLHIEILDQGPGIPVEIADQLGSPFTSNKKDGLGLGLYLSHATLNKLNGSVRLYNRAGGGTLTEIVLPALESDDD
jgi:two-component system sensor histidine kinase RegB